jgi:hypothetical protein
MSARKLHSFRLFKFCCKLKFDFQCFHLHIPVHHYVSISQWNLNPSRFTHGSSMVIKPIVYTSTSAVYYDMSHIISLFHKLKKASNTLQESQ